MKRFLMLGAGAFLAGAATAIVIERRSQRGDDFGEEQSRSSTPASGAAQSDAPKEQAAAAVQPSAQSEKPVESAAPEGSHEAPVPSTAGGSSASTDGEHAKAPDPAG